MTRAKWPMAENDVIGEVGGYLHFYAQEFELYVDNRSALTSGNSETGTTEGTWFSPSERKAGGIHNITLPYVNSIANETSTWDTSNSNTILNRTDADTGFTDIYIDVPIGDIHDMTDIGYRVQVDNMEVSNAGYKGPVLRQRHYTYNMINRSGSAKEGWQIASIARAFQASVYPKMSKGMRIADNVVMPPPMWTITYSDARLPEDNYDYIGRTREYTGREWVIRPGMADIAWATHGIWGRKVVERERGENKNHPSISQAGNNSWRWNMDPFTSVLVNVSISPTSATDGIQVPTSSGWPLVTVMKLTFLEVDQCLANQRWDALVPYSWAQDEDSKFFRGGGGELNPEVEPTRTSGL
tara:strand:- start:2765 stop:3829 length:1065 start_codon:yes stop_codon:yes gene_type:complete